MVSISLHIRRHEGSDTAPSSVDFFTTSTDFYKNDNLYDYHKEIFVFHPHIVFYTTSTQSYDPTNYTARPLNTFKINTAGGYSPVSPIKYNFGDMGDTVAGDMLLRFQNNSFETSYIDVDNATWTTNSWTTGTFSTFKNEITKFVAEIIVNTRNLGAGDSNYDGKSEYNDWTIQFYMNDLVGDGDKHFIVFYPGNDPQADETIVEVI